MMNYIHPIMKILELFIIYCIKRQKRRNVNMHEEMMIYEISGYCYDKYISQYDTNTIIDSNALYKFIHKFLQEDRTQKWSEFSKDVFEKLGGQILVNMEEQLKINEYSKMFNLIYKACNIFDKNILSLFQHLNNLHNNIKSKISSVSNINTEEYKNITDQYNTLHCNPSTMHG